MATRRNSLIFGILCLVFIGLVQGKKVSCKKLGNLLREKKQQLKAIPENDFLSEVKRSQFKFLLYAMEQKVKAVCTAEKIETTEASTTQPKGSKGCAANSHNCDVNAVCTDTKQSYTCTCKKGFKGNGKSCSDVDECTDKLANCDVNAACRNTAGSYTCACNPGYTGNGRTCNAKAASSENDVPDVDECADEKLNTCGKDTQCLNYHGDYTCSCAPGFTSAEIGKTRGKDIKCQDIDECADSKVTPCGENSECENHPGAYWCVCPSGFQWTVIGKDMACKELTGTCAEKPCHPKATCTNTKNSYKCKCKPGYKGNGKHCEKPNSVLTGSGSGSRLSHILLLAYTVLGCQALFKIFSGLCLCCQRIALFLDKTLIPIDYHS